MFVTWKIWKTLRYPLRWHPIFRRIHTQENSVNRNSLFWRTTQAVAGLAAVLFVIRFPTPALIAGLGLMVAIPTLILVFNGTVLGAYWVAAVSSTLAQEYQDRSFDLMALTPRGALGVSWLICTGTIHRGDWLRSSYRILRWVLLFVLVLLGFASAGLVVSALLSGSALMLENQLRIVFEVSMVGVIAAALWIDHVQSIVTACLLGVLLPAYLPQSGQIHELARIIYLLLQTAVYVLIMLTYFSLRLLIFDIFSGLFFKGLLLALVTLLAFYLLREAIINLLWHRLLERFAATAKEYQEVTAP